MDANNTENTTEITQATATAAIGANGQINIVNDDNFIAEVLEPEIPVLVDFWATWCPPCKFMAPIFELSAPEYEGKIKFAKMDVDQSPQIAGALEIQSIPTLMLFRGRNVYAAQAGAMPADALREWIKAGMDHMESVGSEQSEEATTAS